MLTQEVLVTIISTVIGSSGLFALIQFLISRKDKHNERLENLQTSINDVKTDISNLASDITSLKEATSLDIQNLSDKISRGHVIQARIRILRANDELRSNVRHSFEYFRQLHQDITDYENYCATHPDFKNNEAVNSIAHINSVYQELLATNNFLD